MAVERCVTCVLPKYFVRCSDDGICAFCSHDDHKLTYKGEQALVELLESAKATARSRGAAFDCLCAISGGKDSTYALHQMVTKYGMRVLAFTYDHGFSDEQALHNIENAVGTLKVPLVRLQDTGVHRRYLRRNLRVLMDQPWQAQGTLSGLLCAACNMGYVKGANRLATQNRIPLIIQGGSPVQPDVKYLYDPAASYHLNVVLKPAFQVLTHPFFHNPLYPRNAWYHVTGLRACVRSLLEGVWPKNRGLIRGQFFGFIEYDELRIVSVLEKELGWRRPPGRSTTMRFDCKVHFVLDLIRQRTLGVSDKELCYAAMVRKGLLAREEALGRIGIEEWEERGVRDPLVADVLGRLDCLDVLAKFRRLYIGEGEQP